MRNKLFLNLPSAKEVGKMTIQDVKDFINRLRLAVDMIDHETYEGYLSMSAIKDIFRILKAQDRQIANMFLKIFESWVDLDSKANFVAGINYTVDGKSIFGTPLAYYIDNRQNAVYAEMNADISNGKHFKKVIADNKKILNVEVLPFSDMSLYHWFSMNRNPQRQLDPNYKKHSKFTEHHSKKGTISPWTYTDEEALEFLRHAVYAKSRKRLLLHHRKDRRILVFFDENLKAPIYHAYHIPEDDKYEIQKYDNRALKKMKRVSYPLSE